jgi:hypothetical protein
MNSDSGKVWAGLRLAFTVGARQPEMTKPVGSDAPAALSRRRTSKLTKAPML